MHAKKRKTLESAGWKFGDAADFLEMSADERQLLDARVELALAIRRQRKRRHLSQKELGAMLKTSQPRVAKIERAASPQPLEFSIVRGGVPLPSIRNYFMLPNGVGYIGLVGGFQETTASELDEAIASLQKEGMKSLVLGLKTGDG